MQPARWLFSGVAAVLIALAFWWATPWLERAFLVGDLAFTPLEEPAGFRRLAGTGTISGGRSVLAGIANPGQVVAETPPVPADLCRALFGIEPVSPGPVSPGPASPGTVPVAFFTDYRCPYCRVVAGYLADLAEATPPKVRIIRHDWPILGPSSELAARAALAARQQGAHGAFHRRLLRTSFLPNPAYLRSISGPMGVDADRLLADMTGVVVERQLAETRALAALFGFGGTPGLVVGRTVVAGAISEATLRALVEEELAAGPVPACQPGR